MARNGKARRRKEQGFGRARLARLRRDFAVTGDEQRYALALAMNEVPERNLYPSAWQRLEERAGAWRMLYKHLKQASMARWFKALELKKAERFMIIAGLKVEIAPLKRAIEAYEESEEDERERQLDFYRSCAKGDLWVQTIE